MNYNSLTHIHSPPTRPSYPSHPALPRSPLPESCPKTGQDTYQTSIDGQHIPILSGDFTHLGILPLEEPLNSLILFPCTQTPRNYLHGPSKLPQPSPKRLFNFLGITFQPLPKRFFARSMFFQRSNHILGIVVGYVFFAHCEFESSLDQGRVFGTAEGFDADVVLVHAAGCLQGGKDCIVLNYVSDEGIE